MMQFSKLEIWFLDFILFLMDKFQFIVKSRFWDNSRRGMSLETKILFLTGQWITRFKQKHLLQLLLLNKRSFFPYWIDFQMIKKFSIKWKILLNFPIKAKWQFVKYVDQIILWSNVLLFSIKQIDRKYYGNNKNRYLKVECQKSEIM